MKRTFTGIDIGQSGIRIAEIARRKDKFILNELISTDYEEEYIKEGQIIEPEKLTKLLRNLLDSNNITRKYVVSNIFPECVLVKRMQIPQMPSEEIRNALKYLSANELPFDAEEVNMDYAVVGEMERDGVLSLDVAIFITKKDLLLSVISMLKDVGIKRPMIIDIEYLALLYTSDIKLSEKENNILIRIGKYSTDVCLIKGNNMVLSRNMPYSGEEIALRVIEKLGRDEKDCRKLITKCSTFKDISGNGEQEDEVIEIILDYLREFTTEFFKVLSYFEMQLNEGEMIFNNIIMAGRGGYFEFIPSFLTNLDLFKDFGSPGIHYWQLRRSLFSVDPKLRMFLKEGIDSLKFSTAISLAYRGATEEW